MQGTLLVALQALIKVLLTYFAAVRRNDCFGCLDAMIYRKFSNAVLSHFPSKWPILSATTCLRARTIDQRCAMSFAIA